MVTTQSIFKSFLGLCSHNKVAERTIGRWMKQLFTDTSICPHHTDACPECSELETQITSHEQIMVMAKVNNDNCTNINE
jgi:hypothetical protein